MKLVAISFFSCFLVSTISGAPHDVEDVRARTLHHFDDFVKKTNSNVTDEKSCTYLRFRTDPEPIQNESKYNISHPFYIHFIPVLHLFDTYFNRNTLILIEKHHHIISWIREHLAAPFDTHGNGLLHWKRL